MATVPCFEIVDLGCINLYFSSTFATGHYFFNKFIFHFHLVRTAVTSMLDCLILSRPHMVTETPFTYFSLVFSLCASVCILSITLSSSLLIFCSEISNAVNSTQPKFHFRYCIFHLQKFHLSFLLLLFLFSLSLFFLFVLKCMEHKYYRCFKIIVYKFHHLSFQHLFSFCLWVTFSCFFTRLVVILLNVGHFKFLVVE